MTVSRRDILSATLLGAAAMVSTVAQAKHCCPSQAEDPSETHESEPEAPGVDPIELALSQFGLSGLCR